MKNILAIFGVIVTIVYSLIIIWLINDRVCQLITMSLNEVGDFLAGVFGPLAIFWLILGFFQQGKELQQSTTALELQAKELNNSVRQQKELVEVSRQQMDVEIESLKYERQRQFKLAQPNFIFHGSGASHSGGQSKFKSNAKNTGGAINDISIISEKDINLIPRNVPSWEANQIIGFSWEYDKQKTTDTTNILICYTDSLGNENEKTFIMSINNDARHPVAEIHERKS